MNERFLDLAKTISGWTSSDDSEYIGPHSSSIKLYAELIVRECLRIVEPRSDSGDEWDRALRSSAQEIREHFGIE